ncbi:MAG: glycosyltransferase family 4 protein, partial [Patescibacteria group bacterium]|nr:glycosyltransferase family 4 protein [Patescibacteria group bacterium]
KHEVVVYTSNAQKLESFWDDTVGTIDDSDEKNYKVKRYSILQPSKISADLYDFPFTIGSPGPFCPDMWHDLVNLEKKPDLIIATAFPYNHIIPAFIASKKYKIPIIMIPHLHLEFPELYFTGLRITLLHESDIIVVNTETEKNALLKYDISKDKIHVIPPAIAIRYDSSPNLRKKLNLNENSLLVLFAGTKSHAKGTINLIEAMKKLWDESSTYELVLIGSSMNDFKRYLEKQEKRYLDRIHDLGLVSDREKWDTFASCDIFALPSKSESFGISYLEAWLNKKPVIGCNIDAVKDLINDDDDGLLVEFGNINELYLVLEKLKDPKLRNMLGKNGFNKLINKYELQKICEQFEKLCVSVSRTKLHGN